MLGKQLFNECTISHLPIDANGVVRASYRKTSRLLSKGYPYTFGCYDRERQLLLESLKGYFGRRSTVKAGSMDWAAHHPLIGPEQALTWLVESVRAGEWKALQLAPLVEHVWGRWIPLCTSYPERVRCVALLGDVRALVAAGRAQDTSTPRQWKRQQGGNQDV